MLCQNLPFGFSKEASVFLPLFQYPITFVLYLFWWSYQVCFVYHACNYESCSPWPCLFPPAISILLSILHFAVLAAPPPCNLPCASAIKWSSPTSFSHYWWDKIRLVLWRQVLARQGLPETFWWKERPHLASSYLTEGQAGQISSAMEGRRWQRSAVEILEAMKWQVVIKSEMQGVEGHPVVINANRLPNTQILIKWLWGCCNGHNLKDQL